MGQGINLPLSATGYGERYFSEHISQVGMGSLHTGIQDPHRLNISNPAALGSLLYTSLGVGLSVIQSNYEEDQQSETQWDGQASYLHVAMPFQNIYNEQYKENPSKIRLGGALSLSPEFNQSYDIVKLTEEPDLGTTLVLNDGDGQTYSAMYAMGAKYKNLSVGVSTGLYFGRLTREQSGSIDGSQNFTVNSTELSFKGFNYRFGLQYKLDLNSLLHLDNSKENHSVILGAVFAPKRNINTSLNRYVGSERVIFNSNIRLDTTIREAIIDEEIENAKTYLPEEYSVGLSYTYGDQWLWGIEYGTQRWSEAVTNLSGYDNFNDSHQFRTGLSFTPNAKSFNSYWARVSFRAGFETGTDYRKILGEDLNFNSYSLGFGLPISLSRQNYTFVDLALKYTTFEFNNTEGIANSYLSLNIGFTINDNSWFYKQKYQ